MLHAASLLMAVGVAIYFREYLRL